MNCQQFELIIIDIARTQMVEAGKREEGLAHADSCARCAGSLASQRMLTLGLRGAAESLESEGASVQVEAALLAAFSQRQSSRLVVKRSNATGWAIAAAALILVFLAVAVSRMQSRTNPNAGETTLTSNSSDTPQEPSAVQPGSNDSQKVETVVEPKKAQPKPGLRRGNRSHLNGPLQKDLMAQSLPQEAEVTTAFVPFMQGGNMPPLEGGQMVRVVVPRSALAAYGLPVNMELAGEQVKADVFIGNDGLARAIRFVR